MTVPTVSMYNTCQRAVGEFCVGDVFLILVLRWRNLYTGRGLLFGSLVKVIGQMG